MELERGTQRRLGTPGTTGTPGTPGSPGIPGTPDTPGTTDIPGTPGSARPSGKRDTVSLGTFQPGPRELQALVVPPKKGDEGLGSLRGAEGEKEQRAGTEEIPEGLPCSNGILLLI